VKKEIGTLELEYRKDLNVFLCRWSRPIVSSQELRDNYGLILEQLRENQTTLHLIDTRRRGYISPEDEAWIMDVFFPDVEKSTLGIHYYAYLVTPTILKHIQNDVGFEILDSLSPRTKVKVFDVEKDAIEWLRSMDLQQV
jgi:hypothetical protein